MKPNLCDNLFMKDILKKKIDNVKSLKNNESILFFNLLFILFFIFFILFLIFRFLEKKKK
jgi:hypothetical protein